MFLIRNYGQAMLCDRVYGTTSHAHNSKQFVNIAVAVFVFLSVVAVILYCKI